MICAFCNKYLNQDNDEVWYTYAKTDLHLCKECKKDYEEKVDPTGEYPLEQIGPIKQEG